MTRAETKRLTAIAAFAGLLLLALGGWSWVVARTLDNERRVARSELEANRQRLVNRVADGLETRLREANERIARTFEEAANEEAGYFAVIRLGLASGMTFTRKETPVASPPSEFGEWRKRVMKEVGKNLSAELAGELESGGLAWGLDEAGRDPVAALAASLLEESPDDKLAGLLLRRALDDTVPLKPSFRLFLLGKVPRDGFAARLATAESLRAMDGDAAAVPAFGDAEIFTAQARQREIRIYWTPGDLAALAGGFPEGMQLGTGDGAAGYVKRVAGLERRPFLRFSGEPDWFGKTDRLLGIVGTSSGLLLAALLAAAIGLGLRESRIARTRMDLAASVAHELRTPLAGQRLVLESLAAEHADEDKRRDYIGMALRENLRLCHLAEEFLTYSRLERGSLYLLREKVVVREVLESAVEMMGDRLRAGDFALEAEDGLMIEGDADALATVVRNLAENAIKYSDGAPWVRLRSKRSGDDVLLEVEDHGCGISRRDQAKIFRQFFRGDNTLARRSDGLGLGLAIVRRIVEAHHGRIEVTSEPGRGSLFRIHLPALP